MAQFEGEQRLVLVGVGKYQQHPITVSQASISTTPYTHLEVLGSIFEAFVTLKVLRLGNL